jgi:TonB family protein
MFEVLIGSAAVRRTGGGRGLVVAALHGIVIAAAARASRPPPAPPIPPRVDTTVFVLERSTPVISAASAAQPGEEAGLSVELPPVPLISPTGLPPVHLGAAIGPLRSWDRNPLPPSSATPSGHREGRPWLEVEVDEPAVPLQQPSPRYPPILREAGIEGRVELEFVIDTTGRVEEESLKVLSRTAEGFEAAAIESITRSRFTPARMRGQAVRQRARQAISFRIRTP